jgi:hypothetical protein
MEIAIVKYTLLHKRWRREAMTMRDIIGSFLLLIPIMTSLSLCAKAGGAAVYEVGPGKKYTRIIDVPTHALKAGDVVKVYSKSMPYREKFLLHGVGTAAAPIKLLGVPDANGNKPIIDGQNAISGTDRGDYYWNEDRQVVLVGQYSNHLSDYVIIDGFIVRNANRNNIYTNDRGSPGRYLSDAAAIRSEYANHFTIRNCEIYGNENGIFSGHTMDLTIEQCYVHDNGVGDPSSSQEHNLYLGGGAGSNATVQYSRFGELLNDGQQCKFRTATLIFRYNWIEGGKNSQLDLVEDSKNGAADAYVYGNVIIKPLLTNNGRMINFGGDMTLNVRTGTLYFFNNTCVFQAGRNGQIFSISSNQAYVIAENNIFFKQSSYDLAVWARNRNISGQHNWVYAGTLQSDIFTSSLTGSDPGFNDLASQDFTLTATSPCVNVVKDFKPPVGHGLNYQYVKHLSFEPRMDDGALDLGAFELNRH